MYTGPLASSDLGEGTDGDARVGGHALGVLELASRDFVPFACAFPREGFHVGVIVYLALIGKLFGPVSLHCDLLELLGNGFLEQVAVRRESTVQHDPTETGTALGVGVEHDGEEVAGARKEGCRRCICAVNQYDGCLDWQDRCPRASNLPT